MALRGNVAVVSAKTGSYRVLIYERDTSGSGQWALTQNIHEDEICTGGASLTTGWRYRECLKREPPAHSLPPAQLQSVSRHVRQHNNNNNNNNKRSKPAKSRRDGLRLDQSPSLSSLTSA